MKILYLYISSYKFGSGHLKRAEIYQKKFKEKKIYFKKKNLINFQNKLDIEIKKIIKQIQHSDYVFLDISNKFFLSKFICNFLRQILSINSKKFIIIDGLNEEILTNKLRYQYKAIIIPYFFKKKFLNKIKKVKYFLGPEFFMIDILNKHNIKNKFDKKKILFTSGGSDKNNSTLKFLKLFQFIYLDSIIIFIILGPNFLKSNILKIKRFIKKKNMKVKFLSFKKNLGINAKGKDLIITSSGLTKYEILYWNLPMIVYSENLNQKINNESFKRNFHGICFDNLLYNKKNLIKLYNAINKIEYIQTFKKNKKNYLMNNFDKIYKFLKNAL